MKIQSINSMSFGEIRETPQIKFTEEQQKICEDIKKGLRTNKMCDIMTIERFFERIYDIDFILLPKHNDENKVTLYFTNRHLNSVPESGVSSKKNQFKVRDYGESDNLDNLYGDVIKAREKAMNKKLLICGMYSVLLIAALCLLTNIGKISKAIRHKGALIENTDTLIKQTDTIKAKTADFLKIVK